ncbi:EF-P lysine aminoacylase EpmA [Paracoccus sp. SCSIO 75233]|uniref:EF-P lysine aminoacylase EpmA n=1 Tax=Paracoccus sp. SCSIO 75233 TaxID=3017782 RepID=UPI0022F0CD11|nr:EF-P lysine aminoacylase EpmA [Paracoccus sp. SCSIO 75233]WBU52749.1 EF-P lysine aminoacylase EpmA [Paracoccus sp. SCSIO 75233]
MSDKTWWRPERHADRRPALLARNRIQQAIRGWLGNNDFTEVDPAALCISPGNETHLHGFATSMIGNDGIGHPMYLHTSPEFAMKKLLAAGEQRIAAFSHVWRNRERGALHHPEFTMLEWYRTGKPYTTLMDDCADFLMLAAEAAGANEFRFRDAVCDPYAAPERISVADAFAEHAGIDLLLTIGADGTTDRDGLSAQLDRAGIAHAPDDNWSDLFSRVLAERVEPYLGHGAATILDRYPLPEAALARPSGDDPRVAERFELYACGVELANAFGELTDPSEQRRRFQADMAEKARIYGETYPLDEAFLSALPLMPEAAGAALGFDRLVMLATAAPSVDGVMWAPVADPG